MQTIVYLTRHGQTEWNLERRLQGRGNSPLTSVGISGAEELRDRIKDIRLDAIYSSPIERAFLTANIVKGNHDLKVITEEGFMEMSFGDYEGLKISEIYKINPKFNMDQIMKVDINICAPNGETLAQVRERVKEAMDRIIEENEGKSILIVTHGMTLKALMYYFNDKDVNEEVMGQATLTKITVENKKNFKIEFKNDGSHFKIEQTKQGW
ncbi:MAG: histidine phosphatase family protein [Clostridium sp.]|nr:histidine phosphatase family protein [Clostridium sp.]MDU7083568.1 histidine phosphatase family protein [Clostridium sp.]